MTGQIIQLKNKMCNAIVFIDYKMVVELFARFGSHPLEYNFFQGFLDFYREQYHMNIVDCIAYCDFESEVFPRNHQTTLSEFGIQFRHVPDGSENYCGVMITADAISALYKNPAIHQFIFVTGGWDMKPLLNLIQAENKSAVLNLPRSEFVSGISELAQYSDVLEDVFQLSTQRMTRDEELEAALLLAQIDFYHQDQPKKKVSEQSPDISDDCEWWGVETGQILRFH